MEKINFQDRVGEDLKRKRITIISQSADTIIADVEPANLPIQEGTTINAAIMNKFQDAIAVAETNAIEAKESSSNALIAAGQANENASTSLSNSQIALSTAANAETKALEAFNHITDAQGTKVTIEGEFVSTFNADSKVNQSDLSNYLTSNTNQDVTGIKTIKQGLNVNSIYSKILQGGISNSYASLSYTGIRLCSINSNGDLLGYFHFIGSIKETSIGMLTFDFNIHFSRTDDGACNYYYTGNNLSIFKYFDIIVESSTAPFYITLLRKSTYIPTGVSTLNLWQVDVYGLGYSTTLLGTFPSTTLSGTTVSSIS